MLKIGNYNTLTVGREVDFGYYLTTDDGREILLPRKYMPDDATVGSQIEVFVYTDSEDRLIATTEVPFAQVGQFAFMQVRDVNHTGAFLDWGISGKDLLVPFSEQKARMRQGGIYLVYVYLDDETKRVVATAKFEHYVGNRYPDLHPGAEVEALIIEHTSIGYRAIVNNLYWGMIYDNEIFRPLELEETATAYVKAVRDDGKIDLTLSDRAKRRVGDLSDRILEAIEAAGGELRITDASTPDEIRAAFSCSKKDFKKAVGHLYKEKKILLGDGFIVKADAAKILD